MVAAQPLTMNGDTYNANLDQCQQTIDAARAAAKAGTWVYSVAYGANTTSGTSTDCSTDSTAIISGMQWLSSCTEMQNIANSPGHLPDLTRFYSNGNTSGEDCPNANTIENLVSLFQNLSTNLTEPRLIPNNTT